MKRLFVRASIVTSVAALGLLAYYAQAQFGQQAPPEVASQAKPEIVTPEGAPPSIQSSSTSAPASAAARQPTDPFAASSLSAEVLSPAAESPSSAPGAGQIRFASAELPVESSSADTSAPSSGTPYNQMRKESASGGYEPPAFSAAAASAEPVPYAANDAAATGPSTDYPSSGYAPPQPESRPSPYAAAGAESVRSEVSTQDTAAYAPPSAAPSVDSERAPAPLPASQDAYAAPAPLPVAADNSATRLGSGLPNASPPSGTLRPASPQSLTPAAPVAAAPLGGSVRGTGRPGSKQLEGTQTPQLQLRKKAPKEIQVGKPAKFQVFVRNNGSAAAHDVRIIDQVPQGTRLLDTQPQASASGDARVTWQLGTLEPGEEKSVTLQVMPETEGEIGSIASVEFRAEAAARTVATRPQLEIDMSAPKQVMIGEEIIVTLRITNSGTGVATGVTLYNSLPAQLKHEAGSELEFDVGDLAPQESRQIELTLEAAAPGNLTNIVEARDDGSLTTQAQSSLEIVAPQLKVALEGPKRRFLDRRAIYAVSISNAGTAPAEEVELVSHLPKGIQFVSANNAGHYDEGTHTVYWSLAELPEGETGQVELVTMPTESGNHKLVIEGKAARNLSDQLEETIAVEGLAALVFEVVDVQDPVEVGGEAEYEIRVLNQGTKSASDVRVMAELPPGMRALSADGPTRGSIEGSRVVFESLNRLAPKADTTYRIRAEGLQAGDQRIRIQLQSDSRPPITKEESTMIYADR